MRRLFDKNKSLTLKLAALAVILCLCAQSAFAQKQANVFVVKSKDIPSYNQALEGFRKQAPQEWAITEFDLKGSLKHKDEMLDKINESKPDLVVAVGAKALTAVTQSQISQPAVFCASINITRDELAGANITGISLTVSPEEQFQVLTSLGSGINRVGVLLRRKNAPQLLKNMSALAKKQKIELILLELDSENEIPQKLRTSVGQIDALWMLDDAYIHSKETLEFVIGTTIENDLPFMANSEVFVEQGATIALSPSFFDNGRQTAELAKKILEQNINPKDVQISYHEKPDLTINLKIAKKIGLDVPLELVDKAKTVYK